MEIEFITHSKTDAKYFSVEPMKNNLPEWYKNLPLDHEKENIEYYLKNAEKKTTTKTIKGCIPVLDYLLSGYVLKANETILLKSIILKNNVQEIVCYSTNRNSINYHIHAQCPINIKGIKRNYIKLSLGWRIKTPKGYSCLFYQPYYSNIEKKYNFFPAIVDTDVYNSEIAFPGWISTENEELKIEPGDNIMCVFPFKREEWKMKVTASNEFDYNVCLKFLKNCYRTFFWNKKKYD